MTTAILGPSRTVDIPTICLWQCAACNYLHEAPSKQAPKQCAACGHGGIKFAAMNASGRRTFFARCFCCQRITIAANVKEPPTDCEHCEMPLPKK